MNSIDWKRKLTSRKFWMAIAALVTGILTAFNVDAGTVEKVTGLIMSCASAIVYIIAEGFVDAENKEQ